MNSEQEHSVGTMWDEHHAMTFWLWAVEKNAETYLEASKIGWQANSELSSSSKPGLWGPADVEHELERRRQVARLFDETRLAAYHFVSSIGVLIRVLKRSQRFFPEIEPACSRAKHLFTEGKELRDMIEHAYGDRGYLAGEGHHPDRFVRAEAGISADATTTHIDGNGHHWLGNRLCVELVLEEVREIKKVADGIPEPMEEA